MREDEIVKLEQLFYINRTDREDAIYSVSAAELLGRGKMDDFIMIFGTSIKALDSSAAAAYAAAYFSSVALAKFE